MEEQKSNMHYKSNRYNRLFPIYCLIVFYFSILGVYVIEYYVNQTFIMNSFLKLILFYILCIPCLLYRKNVKIMHEQSKLYVPIIIALVVTACALHLVFPTNLLPSKYWFFLTVTMFLLSCIIRILRECSVQLVKQSTVIVSLIFFIMFVFSYSIMAYSAKLHTSWRTPAGAETIASEAENIHDWNKATLGTWDYSFGNDIAIVSLQPKYAIFADEDIYRWLIVPHEESEGEITYKQISYTILEYISPASDACVMNYRGDNSQKIQIKYCSNIFSGESMLRDIVGGTVITVLITNCYKDTNVCDEHGNEYVSLYNDENNSFFAAYWYSGKVQVPQTLIIDNTLQIEVQRGRNTISPCHKFVQHSKGIY